MPVDLRRVLTLTQVTHAEGGRRVADPTRMFAAMAVIGNPWFGRGFVEDLKPEIRHHCPMLGQLLTEELLRLSGGTVEGVGKASVVGMGGEVEHAQALTHSLWFGNQLREAIDAKTYLVFSNTRGAAGCPITIPMMDKDDGGRRSHYQTLQTTIPDAPAEDEIIVALGGSLGGHPHHRIGNRYEDLEEMGRSVDNPAGV